MPKVVVLRWGHRERDKRLTSHVALTARALGASSFILADVIDEKVKATVEKVTEQWGGFFQFEMGVPWRQVVKEWRAKNGLVVHLTAYGENIQTSDVLKRIKAAGKDLLVMVGSRKVLQNSSLKKFLTSTWLLGISLIQNAQAWLFFSIAFSKVENCQRSLKARK